MRFIVALILSVTIATQAKAGPGDSIFNVSYIHTLHITYSQPNIYDSLIATNTTGEYIMVQVDFDGEIYDTVGIKVKGNSSFSNPSHKKSFKLDINEFVSGQDIHGLKKLNFNNLFKDPSFMREKLASEWLIAHGLPAPRVTYCNVYMNDTLYGLYTIVEAIDDEFCEHWFNNHDGNLFQGDPSGDLTWKGSTTQSLYESSYDLENNHTANDWSDLINMINVLNNTPDATLPAQLDNVFNTGDFTKQWAAQNILSSLDAYIGSGHNYYIYHDTIGNKFNWISWDENEVFGTFKMSLTTSALKNMDMYYVSGSTNRPLVNKMEANAVYKAMYNDAYCTMLSDFTNTYFDPIIDSLHDLIQSSVYADTKKFYTNTDFENNINSDVTLTGGGPGGSLTVFGLKSFITERQTGIAASLAANSVTCTSAVSTLPADQFRIYPNPADDVLHIDAATTMRSISVTDITGRQLFSATPANGSQDIPVAGWTPGIYLLKINGLFAGRFVKE